METSVREEKEESAGEQKQYDQFIAQLITCFNSFHKSESFELNETVVPEEEKEELFRLAGEIDWDFEEIVELLIQIMHSSWVGDEIMDTEEDFLSYNKDFLNKFNPYLLKYGYYYNMDITKPYPKACFICRIKSSKSASINDTTGAKKDLKITHLEMITDDYYWRPTSPIYVLPATEEVIILDDLILKEAKACAETIKSLKENEDKLVYKQWKEIANLPEEEIIDKINKDLVNSYEVSGIREAFDSLFLGDDIEYGLNLLSRKLAGLALGPVPFYSLGKIINEIGQCEKAKEIVYFFLSKMEGEKVEVSRANIKSIIDKLMELDEVSIRKYAEEMYQEKFNRDLADGSLKDLKVKHISEAVTIRDLINGKSSIDSLTFKGLSEGFKETGRIGSDDEIGFQGVKDALRLEDINSPVDLISNNIGDVITPAQWEELVKLYPYLEMLSYKEAKDNRYLENHWKALQRAFIFNKYPEELRVDMLRENPDYIESKIEECKKRLASVSGSQEGHDREFDRHYNKLDFEIPGKIEEIYKKIEGKTYKIMAIESEIAGLNSKFFKKKRLIAQKEEERTKLITELEGYKEEKDSLEEEVNRRQTRREELSEILKEEQKQIEEYEEIIAGLEGKMEEVKEKPPHYMRV